MKNSQNTGASIFNTSSSSAITLCISFFALPSVSYFTILPSIVVSLLRYFLPLHCSSVSALSLFLLFLLLCQSTFESSTTRRPLPFLAPRSSLLSLCLALHCCLLLAAALASPLLALRRSLFFKHDSATCHCSYNQLISYP